MARRKANTKRYKGSAVLRLDRGEDEKTWKKGKKAEAKELGLATKTYRRKISFEGQSVEFSVVALFEYQKGE